MSHGVNISFDAPSFVDDPSNRYKVTMYSGGAPPLHGAAIGMETGC